MLFKQLILDAIRHAGAFGLSRRLRRGRYAGATVLLFHRVLPADASPDHYVRFMDGPTVPQLEALLRYLKRWFRFSTTRECVERWRAGREVDPYTLLLTFDDGYADMHDLLLPVLRRVEVPAAVFVTTGAMSGYVTWFQRLFSAVARTPRRQCPPFATIPAGMPLNGPRQRVGVIEAVSKLQRRFPAKDWEGMIDRLCEELEWDGCIDDERMMDWGQVEALHRSGWVTVGNHTVTHPLLWQCTLEQSRQELFDSADELRARLRPDFLPFSYPNGLLPPPGVIDLVRESGHDCAFTGIWAPNTCDTPLFALGRQQVVADNVSRASLELSRAVKPRRQAGSHDEGRPETAGVGGVSGNGAIRG